MDTQKPKPTLNKSFDKNIREAAKRKKRLLRLTSQAIADFNLIEAHDRVMVCVSGGKDSLTLLHILETLRQRAPIPFQLIAMNLDQGQPGYPTETLPQHFQGMGIDYHIETQNTYRVVKRIIPEGKTQCSLCARLRRGIIYRVAKELKITKIALGHHRDDILATFFLNLFFAGQLKTMPIKLQSDDRAHLVIRPLAYCEESDCAAFAAEQNFPIIPCTLCGSQAHLQRLQMREMLEQWKKKHPGRINSIFRALGQVKPEFLLDPNLFDFSTLQS